MVSDLEFLTGCIFVCALSAATMVCLLAEPLGRHLNIMDVPDRIRKRHVRATPLAGGIAIMTAVLIWTLLRIASAQAVSLELSVAVLLCGSGVALVGLADDRYDLSPPLRMLFVAIFLLIACAIDPHLISDTLRWTNFAPVAIPAWLFVPLFTLAAVGCVNAVNMADGMNGVVPSMFMVWSVCMIIACGPQVWGVATAIFFASVVVLAFNLRGKLFLGDTGTYGVTFIIGLLVAQAHARGFLALDTICVWFFLPVMDCLRLLISRPLIRGISPFQGGLDHFHHYLKERLGARWGVAAYACAMASTSLAATLAPQLSLICMAALAAFYVSVIWSAESESEDVLEAGLRPMIAALHRGADSDEERRNAG
jgi:UDP-GlcNAc:undecaprenyl-phosphate/decaprenyl-phosphate GlcNAc-1-phosphate transferase